MTTISPPTDLAACACWTCETARIMALDAESEFEAVLGRRFVVCPDCGNKRCPKATYHDNACTKSNEPGQPGSRYA